MRAEVAGGGGSSGTGAAAGRGGSGSSSTGGSGGSSDPGGSGGSGDTGGSGGGAATDGPYAAVEAGTGSPGIRPIAPLPPRRSGNTVFHSTNVSMWEIHDLSVYIQYRANFDQLIDILERGYSGYARRLGTGHRRPLRVIIEPGACCGGWADGGDVGYRDGNFKSELGMNWTRQDLAFLLENHPAAAAGP